MKINKKIIIILFSILIFLPSLFNFFSADDWFHLYIVKIDTLDEFLNFFSFFPNHQSAAFYRPIPTQLFFFVFHSLFGLNSLPYYFFVLVCFGISLFLVYRLAYLLTYSTKQSLVTTFIYGVSVTNFSRIYFLSAFQEILLVTFTLFTLVFFIEKRYYLSLTFFILALMSKETAVVIPVLFLCLRLTSKKNLPKPSLYLPHFVILVVYLYFRLFVFGLAEGDTYVWDFSIKSTLNTLMWYAIWTLGAPELFVDYVGGGFRIIPRFFTDYPNYSYVVIVGLLSLLSLLFVNLIKNLRTTNRIFVFALAWYLFTILPVLFLPSHKFALELGLPLFGFALAVSQILDRKFLGYLFLFVYLAFNLTMNHLTYTRHYSTRRAIISERVYDYVVRNYHPCPNKPFLFYNLSENDYTKDIELTISGENMLKVVCNNSKLETIFNQPINSEYTIIPADRFFPL